MSIGGWRNNNPFYLAHVANQNRLNSLSGGPAIQRPEDFESGGYYNPNGQYPVPGAPPPPPASPGFAGGPGQAPSPPAVGGVVRGPMPPTMTGSGGPFDRPWHGDGPGMFTGPAPSFPQFSDVWGQYNPLDQQMFQRLQLHRMGRPNAGFGNHQRPLYNWNQPATPLTGLAARLLQQIGTARPAPPKWRVGTY